MQFCAGLFVLTDLTFSEENGGKVRAYLLVVQLGLIYKTVNILFTGEEELKIHCAEKVSCFFGPARLHH